MSTLSLIQQKSLEDHIDEFVREGGLRVQDVKEIAVDPGSGRRDVSWNFRFGDKFHIFICIYLWPEQDGALTPYVWIELALGGVPLDKNAAFFELLLSENQKMPIPARYALFGEYFGLSMRSRADIGNPQSWLRMILTMAEYGSAFFNRAKDRYHLETMQQACYRKAS